MPFYFSEGNEGHTAFSEVVVGTAIFRKYLRFLKNYLRSPNLPWMGSEATSKRLHSTQVENYLFSWRKSTIRATSYVLKGWRFQKNDERNSKVAWTYKKDGFEILSGCLQPPLTVLADLFANCGTVKENLVEVSTKIVLRAYKRREKVGRCLQRNL